MAITDFGKYSNDFDIMKEKGATMNIIVLIEDLTKLINPNVSYTQYEGPLYFSRFALHGTQEVRPEEPKY